MEPANPFAPPSAPLGEPTPRPARSPWSALWWFPTAIFGVFTILLFLGTSLSSVRVVYEYSTFDDNLNGGWPPVYWTALETLIMGMACFGCGLISHAWWRRRWVRALVLMALFYGVGVATALWFKKG